MPSSTGSPYFLGYPTENDSVQVHADIQSLAEDAVSALNLKLNLTGGTLIGNLTISKASASLTMTATTGNAEAANQTVRDGITAFEAQIPPPRASRVI